MTWLAEALASYNQLFKTEPEAVTRRVVTALERGYEGAPHPRVVEAMVGFQLEEP